MLRKAIFLICCAAAVAYGESDIFSLYCQRQRMGWLKAVFFNGAKMETGSDHFQTVNARHLVRSKVKLVTE